MSLARAGGAANPQEVEILRCIHWRVWRVPNSWVMLAIDGVGAYDTFSRRAMFQGLADMPDGDKLIPFYDSPSSFWWEDDTTMADELTAAASQRIPHAVVWRGDHDMPVAQ